LPPAAARCRQAACASTSPADCFRREPSRHLDRLQSFRMREYVCIGSPDDVSDFRERWMVRGPGHRRDLGLTFKVDYASDPFFGRVGQMKAVSQKQQSLKFELLVPLRSEEQPTACMSFNYHRDHFGTTWDIVDAAHHGEPAHTGCVAFGMDRLAVAMTPPPCTSIRPGSASAAIQPAPPSPPSSARCAASPLKKISPGNC
jgi:seryl-tRNA synthetase